MALDTDSLNRLTRLAARMRRLCLETAKGKSSHFGAGLSLIEILALLYGRILRLDPKDPQWPGRDRFILSKGHGVLGYYAALAAVGCIPEEDLQTFETSGSYLAGHPVKNPARGIEYTGGSLGMGLGLGVGTALAFKKKASPARVYVLLGDGELNEGSVWEAFMAAAQFKLDNLTAVVDHNGLQLGGKLSEVMDPGDIAAKARAFGWEALEADGHDFDSLDLAFAAAAEASGPGLVVARTAKGRGFSFAENNNEWHHAVLSASRYEEALAELPEEER